MADWDEITKAYREKVREYYGGHIVFVDPKQFNGDPDDDWKTFVKMFKEQFPDDAVLDMDVFQISASVFSDEELIKMIIDFSRHSGPAAMPLDDSVCVVIEPDERFATKEGAVSFRSHIPEDELLPLPQKTVDYIKYIAAHEGPHCWDILPPMEEKTLPLHLKDETVSDFVADMDARGDGQAQVADIFRHSSAMREDFSAWRTRKLSADAHATHIALNDLYEGEGIDYQSVADFLRIILKGFWGGWLKQSALRVQTKRRNSIKTIRSCLWMCSMAWWRKAHLMMIAD